MNRRNLLKLKLSNSLYDSNSAAASLAELRTALQEECLLRKGAACDALGWATGESVIAAVDSIFFSDMDRMIYIDGEKTIAKDMLLPGGSSPSNIINQSSGELMGSGYFQWRVFLVSEGVSCWRISVNAMNDDPAPVNFSVEIEQEPIGVLAFVKGDHSWETLATHTMLDPGLYRLSVRFTNDYFDVEKGLDRNAYVDHVKIEQVMEVHCDPG